MMWLVLGIVAAKAVLLILGYHAIFRADTGADQPLSGLRDVAPEDEANEWGLRR